MHKPFFITRHRAAAAACVAPGLASSAAWADCETRKTRPAETAFNARAMAALASALPPAPVGVVAVDALPFDFKNPPGIRAVLCDGSEEGEFSITARRQYVRKPSEADRTHWSARYDRVTAQFHALKKTPPEKAGDKAAVQASDEKYRSLRDQADRIDAPHQDSVRPQLSELDQRRIAIDLERQQVDIMLSMNLGKSVGLKVHNDSFGVVGADGTLRQALVGKPLPSEAGPEAAAATAAPAALVTPAAPPPAGEPVKKAADAVNLLRGLFGR